MKKIIIRKLHIAQFTLILVAICSSFATINAQESEAIIKARITDLTAKIASIPNNDNLYIERGTALMQVKRYDEALSDAAKALQLNPKSFQAVLLRGNVKYERKDYDGAIADYSSVINPSYRYSDAYFWRGRAYEGKGENEKALADYNKAAQIQPLIADMIATFRERLEAKMNGTQNPSANAPKKTATRSNNDPPEITMDAINQQSANMTPQMREQANQAAKSQLKPEDYKIMELTSRKQTLSNSYSELLAAYDKASTTRQQIEILNRLKNDSQTALTEAVNAEKQNLNFSSSQQKTIADYKSFYLKALDLVSRLIAERQGLSGLSQSKENPNFGSGNTGSAQSSTQTNSQPAPPMSKDDKKRAAKQALAGFKQDSQNRGAVVAQEGIEITQTNLVVDYDRTLKLEMTKGYFYLVCVVSDDPTYQTTLNITATNISLPSEDRYYSAKQISPVKINQEQTVHCVTIGFKVSGGYAYVLFRTKTRTWVDYLVMRTAR